ncbi:hypothetical protein [Deinococcus sp. ME38]|uniref:hypothetical protein n=1 Tax=Deinococcus sp. ME38 TaxID=3400344 RepID=UPI003B59FD8A
MRWELRFPPSGREVNVWFDELPSEFVVEVGSPEPLIAASLTVPSCIVAMSQWFPLNNCQAALIGGQFQADESGEFRTAVEQGLLAAPLHPSGVLTLTVWAHDQIGSSPLSFRTAAQSLLRLIKQREQDENSVQQGAWWVNPLKR